jgi:hypothetical protein
LQLSPHLEVPCQSIPKIVHKIQSWSFDELVLNRKN